MLAFVAGCAAPCPDGELASVDGCRPYEPGEPEPHDVVWRPPPRTSWQWQLSGAVDPTPDVVMFDVDLFDAAGDIARLHEDGRVVVCYFSAGSVEDWRPDAADVPQEAIGAKLDGWTGERWLDVSHPGVRAVMAARLDRAVAAGCDGVEPDNVDGYQNDNGVDLTATMQLDFNRFLADAAHQRGLSVGLKNDLDQIEALLPWFDWALNEECAAFDECDRLAPFAAADLAVFHTEYVEDWSDAPSRAAAVCGAFPELSTLIKTWDLGPERLTCP